jgi:hypothetical protein
MHDALTARFTDADEIKDVANYGCAGGVMVSSITPKLLSSSMSMKMRSTMYSTMLVLYEELCRYWLYY